MRLRVAFEAFEEDAAGDAGGDAGGDADARAAPADSEAAQKAAATIQASWKGKKTRDGVRFLSREKKETKKSNGASPLLRPPPRRAERWRWRRSPPPSA